MSSPFQKMQAAQEHFTKNDKRIYETILKDPGGVAFASTSELAQICGVSQPAVTRFVKSLGYARYQDFRSELVSFLARNDADVKTGRQKYFSDLHTLLNMTEDQLPPDYLDELAAYVLSFERLFVSGIGKSALPAQLFSIYVRKLGVVATLTDDIGAKDYGAIMTERDLMLLFSVNGQPEIFRSVMDGCGALLIVTAGYKARGLRDKDRLVALPYLTTNAEEGPVSPVLFSIFVELLVACMTRRLA